ncbi:MAG TPA: EamA family transporter [Aestuariivirgaceae bacterium]
MSAHARGILANVLWGLVPLYYLFVRAVDPLNMLIYRSLFTFLILTLLGLLRFQVFSFRKLRSSLVPALLLALNGYVYIVAVLNGQVIEAAYGYLITPILIILCGRVLLGEKLTGPQWLGVGLCFIAITYYATAMATLPWYGLGIALPFALYSTLHKKSRTVDAIGALRHEMVIMFALAAGFVVYFWNDMREEMMTELGGTSGLIVILSGPVTVLPLVLFLGVCSKLTALHLGIYQFISPILSSLIAVTLFDDPLSAPKLTTGTILVIGMAFAVLPSSIFVRVMFVLSRLFPSLCRKSA